MRRLRRLSVAALLASSGLAFAPRAAAQEQQGYAANHINLSERGSQWFVLDSLDIRGNGRLALGVVNDYSFRTLVDYASDGDAQDSIVRQQYFVHLGGSVVLADRVRLGVTVPLQLFADGHTGFIGGVVHRPSEDAAVGDVRLSGDVRIFGEHGDAATLAIGAQFFAPSGSPTAYTGDGEPRFAPHVLFAGQASSFAYAARAGFMIHARDEDFGDGHIGNQLTAAVSAGVVLADGKALIGPELFGSTVVADGRAFENRTTPLEALLGAHVDVGANLRLGAGVGAGLTRGYGAPVARGLLSLDWVPSSTPLEVEVVELEPDRDLDGVPDCVDACGFVRGLRSDDPAANGCPPPDSDHDGIPDVVDACRLEPGTASRDEKINGCPPDTDKDGVVDGNDACPREAGQATQDPKTTGCPPAPPEDPDRDKDGVPNDADACPDAAGEKNADAKKNGCPKAFLDKGTIVITDQVRFETGRAAIVKGKESADVLEAVLAVLKAHPEIKHLRVEGHTDNRGNPTKNQALSLARAKAVVTWLVEHGVDEGVLEAKGFGADKPIDSNETESGRTNNRRVEFHVVETGSGR